MMATESEPRIGEERPIANGPALAAMAAAGAGASVLGILTVLSEASPAIKSGLKLYTPVGPLSGVTVGAVAAYGVAWLVLGVMLRGREVRVGPWIGVSLALTGLGLLLTFPPVFQVFAGK